MEVIHNGELVIHPKVRPSASALPLKSKMLRNAATALGQALRNPARVSDEEQTRRLTICQSCEFYLKEKRRCSKCGCFVRFKTWLAAWHCPIKKW